MLLALAERRQQNVGMRDDLDAVLRLQSEWAPSYDDAMTRRRVAVARRIPSWLRERASSWAPRGGFEVGGSGGQGRPSQVPWVRAFDPKRSPSATSGWYAVYLFGFNGEVVYLSLNQGTTVNDANRPADELQARVRRARTLLADQLRSRQDLLSMIDLSSSLDRPKGYEIGNVAAFAYSRGLIPDEETLLADLRFMVDLVVTLQREDVLEQVSDAASLVEEAAGKRRRFPRRMTAAQRVAVEVRAVHVASEHLRAQGYSVVDVGATSSYDLDARRGQERLFVEVKGTTSPGEQIVLTRAEVQLHQREYPNTMLAVVSGISLDRGSDTASGGDLYVVRPWAVEDERLEPMAYRYDVPR
jgi:hypothetical protein